jgi:DNA-binding NarL/FixJ family response regulator
MKLEKTIKRSFADLAVGSSMRRDSPTTLPLANPAKSSHETHFAHEFHGSRVSIRPAGSRRSMEDPMAGAGPELPDVALLDAGLPGMSGIEALRVLKERYPKLLFLMLTVYDDEARIFDAICAWACGYLRKNTAPAHSVESVTDAIGGGSPMSLEAARRIIELFRETRPPEDAGYRLTPIETRLLQLLVDGHNYKTASAEVAMGPHAVSFHMRNIYEKLQVHSKAEAVAKALRHRIVH